MTVVIFLYSDDEVYDTTPSEEPLSAHEHAEGRCSNGLGYYEEAGAAASLRAQPVRKGESP